MTLVRVRLANPSEIVTKTFPEHIRKFYFQHAKKSFEIINSEKIQKILDEILNSEEISREKIYDVRIMIFPPILDPHYTSGMINHDLGQISIFPIFSYSGEVIIPDCLLNFENEDLIFVITVHIFNTLVHEILHLKYDNEEIIEKKTEEYAARMCKKLGFV